jgi:hypothetical protein
MACSGWRSDSPAARVPPAATADPEGAGGIPANGRVHLAHSPNATHFARDESRPLCDDSPEPSRFRTGRLARECRCQRIRAETCDRLTITSSFSRGNSSCAKRAQLGSAALRGTESWVSAARRTVPNRSSSAFAPEWIVEGEPAAPGASHANRQVRIEDSDSEAAAPTELCIEPVSGRQLRRGACVEA